MIHQGTTVSQEYASVNMLEYALEYASGGRRVFPLHSIRSGVCSCPLGENCTSAGKHPRTLNGVKDATTDEKKIYDWWIRWPDANIGGATGVDAIEGAPPLIVVDEDTLKGAKREDLGEIPNTYTVQTG